jgi:hypothetical protein
MTSPRCGKESNRCPSKAIWHASTSAFHPHADTLIRQTLTDAAPDRNSIALHRSEHPRVKSARILAAAAFLALLVGGLWWSGVWGGGIWPAGTASTESPSPPLTAPPAAATNARPEAMPPASLANPEPIREAPQPDQTTPFAERATVFAQGLRGLAVDTDNHPLSGVQIFLLESLRNEPLALPSMQQLGIGLGPLAETRSATDGTFAIGLHLANDKLYELRLLSPAHADTRIGDVKILAGEWLELGSIVMQNGTTVRGRVTIAGTDTPVPQAVVTLEAGTAFEDLAMRSLPGRERGLCAQVDARGYYELRNAPTRGVIQLSAAAQGFGRVLQKDIELHRDQPITVDFQLPPGLVVRGDVVDQQQRPIPRVRIEAWPQQSASPAAMSSTNNDGAFEVIGLVSGTYRMRILARGYQDLELRDVAAGRSDLHFVLQARATVSVRVLGPDQRVQRRYQLGIRRYFANEADPLLSHIGLLAELPDQRVRLDGMTDAITVLGLPPGRFVAEVAAEGFAKSLSPVFEIEADTATLAVDCQLHQGGTLRGRVLDEAGKPVAEATVETQANGATPDNPVWRMLASAAPNKITKQKVKTSADGSFQLSHLAFAEYQLMIDHPEACRTLVPDLRVEADGEQTLPTIQMPFGATIQGRTTVGGQVPGQMKVLLTTVVDTAAPPALARLALRLETVTDSSGAFVFDRRVPPGNYELRAAVVGTADPDAQIFQQLLQLQRSSTTLSVAPGQRVVEQNLELPADH